MNKINLSYLMIGLCAVLVLLILSISFVKNDLKNANAQLVAYEANAKNFNALKSKWEQKRLESRLRSIIPEGVKIDLKSSGGKYSLISENMPIFVADGFIKKIFNEAFVIKGLDIKRIDTKNVKLIVELGS